MCADSTRDNPSPSVTAFNRQLDRKGPHGWCEEALVDRLCRLDAIGSAVRSAVQGPVLALSLARLAELALLCAGSYADGAAFALAGDLLATPRRVDVHRKGRHQALIKGRHETLSNLLTVNGPACQRAAWLAANTYSLVHREALLPELYRRLTDCGLLAAGYLSAVARRMRQVAATMAFLSAWQIRDHEDLCRCLQLASASDRELLEAHLCRFSPGHFHALGVVVRRLAACPGRTKADAAAGAPCARGGVFFTARYVNIDTTVWA